MGEDMTNANEQLFIEEIKPYCLDLEEFRQEVANRLDGIIEQSFERKKNEQSNSSCLINSNGNIISLNLILRNIKAPELPKITDLPESIGNLKSLKDLTITGGQIRVLPESIANCTKLEKIQINSRSMPEWFMQLFNLILTQKGSVDWGHRKKSEIIKNLIKTYNDSVLYGDLF